MSPPACSTIRDPIIGHEWAEIAVSSISYKPPRPVLRFLLDDEIIDVDEPAIEELAASLGMPPDDLISDYNGDGFLDLPAGMTLELPTGQVGDEALFDVASYGTAFPFQSESAFTSLDFLAEGTALQSDLATQTMQNVEWSGSNAPLPDFVGNKVLDPVPGVDPVDSHSKILALPDDPEVVYVSPVFKSDVAMQVTAAMYGSPTANLQGERRGLGENL